MIKKVSIKYAALASAVVLAGCSGGMKSADVEVEPVKPVYTDESSESYMYADTIQDPGMESADLINAVGENKVHFAFDSASLTDAAQTRLKAIAKYVKTNGVESITVEGHCDERGTREYNLALGDRRAVAVKRYLVGLGVSPQNIKTISYGKERPANTAHTPEAWAENRRAVVLVK